MCIIEHAFRNYGIALTTDNKLRKNFIFVLNFAFIILKFEYESS